MTRNHRTLLQCCTDSNIDFVSERSTTAPKRIGHGCIQHVYSMSTLGVPPVSGYLSGGPCTQSRVGASRPADLDHLDHAAHGPALQLLASDHCVELFLCGPRAHTAKAKRSSRGTWRLDRFISKTEYSRQ